MKESTKNHWKLWAFVIGLNFLALVGAIYLKSNGVDVFALK